MSEYKANFSIEGSFFYKDDKPISFNEFINDIDPNAIKLKETIKKENKWLGEQLKKDKIK